jgi:hypothetical protein
MTPLNTNASHQLLIISHLSGTMSLTYETRHVARPPRAPCGGRLVGVNISYYTIFILVFFFEIRYMNVKVNMFPIHTNKFVSNI